MTSENDSHLRVLSICWYVWAAWGVLTAIAVLGVATFVFSSIPGPRRPEDAEAFRAFGGMMWLAILAVCGFAVAAAVISALAGYWIRRRRAWVFCIVASCLALTSAPLGTVLGVFTLVLLFRPEVREQFEAAKAAGPG